MFGLIIILPSMRATRTSEIGPLKGMSDTISAADAAKPAMASGMLLLSELIIWIITWVPAW